jgi:hypothetical protein
MIMMKFELTDVEVSDISRPVRSILGTSLMMQDTLYYKQATVESLLNPLLWRAICPFLTCDVKSGMVALDEISPSLTAAAASQLCNRGYFQVNSSQIHYDELDNGIVERLALGVIELMRYGYSPLFLLMYNETWTVTNKMRDITQSATSGIESFEHFFVCEYD